MIRCCRASFLLGYLTIFFTTTTMNAFLTVFNRRSSSARSPSLESTPTRLWSNQHQSSGGNQQNNEKGKPDTFDGHELQRRIGAQNTPYVHLFGNGKNDNAMHDLPETVYIVTFLPNTPQQGIHTIEYPKNSGSNVVMAFCEVDACEEFCRHLHDQGFFEPHPQAVRLESLYNFADTVGVFCQVVPPGTRMVPPTEQVSHLGQHDSSLRHDQSDLDYVMYMMEEDIEEEGALLSHEAVGSGHRGSWQ